MLQRLISSPKTVHKIGQFATIIGGGTPKSDEESNFGGDIPWITPKDLTPKAPMYTSKGERNLTAGGLASCSAKWLPQYSILVSSRAPIGLVTIASCRLTTNQGFRSLIVNEEIADAEYVYYCINSSVALIECFASGSTFPEVSGSSLSKVPLEMHNLPEQREISSILRSFDNLLEINAALCDDLLSMCFDIFKKMFVDFDIGQNENTIELVDSEFGPIPAGWSVGNILDFAEILTGGTPKTTNEDYWNGDIPWASGRDISKKDIFLFDSERTITQEGVDNSSTKVLAEGTTVITARGTVGANRILGVPCAMSQTSFGFKTKGVASDLFVYCASQEMIRQLSWLAYGAVFDTFTQETVRRTRMVVPSTEYMLAFEQKTKPLYEYIRELQARSESISETRDVLIRQLLH